MGDPPSFGCACIGNAEIFLRRGAQGGRGKGGNATTFSVDGAGDKDRWMSVRVGDVDAVHRHCVERGIEATFPPTDMPLGVRETRIRHPDGHVFRIGRGIGEG